MHIRIASITWLILVLAVFVLAAAPLALYSWHVLSELLSGRADARSLSIAAGFAATFLLLARWLGRALGQITAEAE